MSVTTTTNSATYQTLSVLADYDLHHSGHGNSATPASNPHPVPSRDPSPPDWPTNHRRVPSHRPINRELDQSQRRVYQSPIEHAFISTMFFGLNLNVTIAQTWRATGGRINDRIFHYKIGGEW